MEAKKVLDKAIKTIDKNFKSRTLVFRDGNKYVSYMGSLYDTGEFKIVGTSGDGKTEYWEGDDGMGTFWRMKVLKLFKNGSHRYFH